MKWKWWDTLLVLALAIGFIILGYGWWVKSKSEQPKVEYLSSSNSNDRLFVDVAGAVINPGVYELIGTARLKDALVAAGGLAASADREYVAKNMNLAEKVKDGEKIYVPDLQKVMGETTDGVVSNTGGKININTAGLSELDGLWGVGEVRAKLIIDSRPYKSVEELVSKKVLTASVVEKNKGVLTVY